MYTYNVGHSTEYSIFINKKKQIKYFVQLFELPNDRVHNELYTYPSTLTAVLRGCVRKKSNSKKRRQLRELLVMSNELFIYIRECSALFYIPKKSHKYIFTLSLRIQKHV